MPQESVGVADLQEGLERVGQLQDRVGDHEILSDAWLV